MIWFKNFTVNEIQQWSLKTMVEHLNIRITEIGEDFISATMPVDRTTHQPHGILHGGASVALAETLGSIGANMVIDGNLFSAVGMEINANHVRPVSSGFVTGTAKPLHIGRKSHVWEIIIKTEEGKPVCFSRITMAIVNK